MDGDRRLGNRTERWQTLMARWECVWRSKATMALWVGGGAGVVFGGIDLAFGKSAGGAIASGVLFGVLYGAWMTFTVWNRWPGAQDLAPNDRIAVVGTVRRGLPIGDAGLAPAVLDYTAVVRRTYEHERSYGWVLLLFAGGTLAAAVLATANGSTREVVVLWAFVAFWCFVILRTRGRRDGVLSRALREEQLAQEMIARDRQRSDNSPSAL